jgi:hypothetical protein
MMSVTGLAFLHHGLILTVIIPQLLLLVENTIPLWFLRAAA